MSQSIQEQAEAYIRANKIHFHDTHEEVSAHHAYISGYTACAESSVPLELAKDMATAIDALIKFTQARDDYGEAAKALGRQALDKAKSYLP